jgi:hypothetical protein
MHTYIHAYIDWMEIFVRNAGGIKSSADSGERYRWILWHGIWSSLDIVCLSQPTRSPCSSEPRLPPVRGHNTSTQRFRVGFRLGILVYASIDCCYRMGALISPELGSELSLFVPSSWQCAPLSFPFAFFFLVSHKHPLQNQALPVSPKSNWNYLFISFL